MKILVPVDLSSGSRHAVEFLASRKTLLGASASIELLNVQMPLKHRSSILFGQGAIDRYYEEHAERVFTRCRQVLNSEGLFVRESMQVGVPDQKIAEEAKRYGADLIVMGTRGLGALRGLFMTSVSTGVISMACCPVLLVKEKQGPLGDDLHVGVCVDGSSYGAAAAQYILKHPKLFGRNARFDLINVVNDYRGAALTNVTGIAMPTLSEQEITELEQNDFKDAMSKVQPLFERAKLETHGICLVGNPASEITAYAETNGIDLLVTGTHGYTRLKSAVMGSTAQTLAAHSSIPLLVVQSGKPEQPQKQP